MTKVIQKLKSHFKDKVLTPDMAHFKKSCYIVNAHINCKTRAIVNCHTAEDIARGVKIAREYDVPLSVASGRQSFTDRTFLKEGITLDVSTLKNIQLDVNKKMITTQAAVSSIEVMKALKKKALLLPLGSGKHASIAGYTMNGGLSPVSSVNGIASDFLKEATLIDCSGEILKLSETENPDLFWALRGGGEHFGIVTNLTFKLKVITQKILAGFFIYPVQEFKQVGSVIIEKMVNNTLPSGLNVAAVLLDSKMVTEKLIREVGDALIKKFGNSQFMLVSFTHFGDNLGKAQKDINGIRGACGNPFFQHISAFDYWDYYDMIGEVIPKKWSLFLKQYFVDHTKYDQNYLGRITDAIEQAPSKNFFVDIASFGRKINEKDSAETAFFHRQSHASTTFGTKWLRKQEADTNIDYIRKCHEKFKPYLSDYSYKPFGDPDLEDWNKAYYGDNYDRLLKIKQKRDPGNLFRRNFQDLMVR